MPHVRSVAFVALATLVVGACFDFDATTAGGPLGDAGSHDASFADSAGDASGDARDGGDGGSFCASLRPEAGAIFFCDDFDEHPLPGSWGTFDTLSGTLEVNDAAAVSKPNSLVEKTMPLASGQVIDVALRTPLGVPILPATLRFTFSVDPVQIDTTARAAIVLGAIDFLDGVGNRYSVGLAINVEGGAPALVLDEQSGLVDGGMPFIPHPLPPSPIATNKFTELVLEIDWTSAMSGTAKVFVDGTKQLDVPLQMTVRATSLQIGIGTSYVTEPSPVWELRYDDVWFVAK